MRKFKRGDYEYNFLMKISIPKDPTDCWNWLACKDKNGYG